MAWDSCCSSGSSTFNCPHDQPRKLQSSIVLHCSVVAGLAQVLELIRHTYGDFAGVSPSRRLNNEDVRSPDAGTCLSLP